MLMLIAVVISMVAVSSASAIPRGAEVQLNTRPDLRSTSLVVNAFAENNRMALATVTPSGGSPDLVIGDIAVGIADPIPSVCARVDATTIRCPQLMINDIRIDLGPGNDTVSARDIHAAEGHDISQIYVNLGKGNDVAVGGPFPNVLLGGPGRDMLMGGAFSDRLFGGADNDFLVGLEGKDLFQCGKGPEDLFNDGPGKDLVNVRTCEHRVHKVFLP
jgi:hypothetical protein